MRVFGAAVMAGVLVTGAAQAQAIIRTVPGVIVASDIGGPYDDVGPPPPPPGYAPPSYLPRAYGPPPGYGPTLPPYAYAPPVLPLHEIYRIVRDSGYSPLGAPQQRGPVYTIAVIDPDGEDGRLVIDARNGRIIRFMQAYRYGARSTEDVTAVYGPPSALPPLAMAHPPVTALQPRASVPVPKPRTAEKSTTVGQAAVPPAPTAAVAAVPAAPAPAAPKPAVTLQPTQAMPPAQGVE